MKKLLFVLITLAFVACSSTGSKVVNNNFTAKSEIEIVKSLKVKINDTYDDLVKAYGEGRLIKGRSNSEIDVIYYKDLGVSFVIYKDGGNKIVNIIVEG